MSKSKEQQKKPSKTPQRSTSLKRKSVKKATSAKSSSKSLDKSMAKKAGSKSSAKSAKSNKSKSSSKQKADVPKKPTNVANNKGEDKGKDEQAEASFLVIEAANSTENTAEKKSDAQNQKLEFTKPTINQMDNPMEQRKKAVKEAPLPSDEFIPPKQFEQFNDEITELNSNIASLRLSYGSVVKSLVAMLKKPRENQSQTNFATSSDAKVNFPSISQVNKVEMQEQANCLQAEDKYDLSLFANPVTREETFQLLFDEVETLNAKTEKLRTLFYDVKGNFLFKKYDTQAEIRVERKQFNEFWLWTRKLASVVEEIQRCYNDDLLNYFRLH